MEATDLHSSISYCTCKTLYGQIDQKKFVNYIKYNLDMLTGRKSQSPNFGKSE